MPMPRFLMTLEIKMLQLADLTGLERNAKEHAPVNPRDAEGSSFALLTAHVSRASRAQTALNVRHADRTVSGFTIIVE